MIALVAKFSYKELDVFLTRKNIKNIYLRIYPPNGEVRLSVPFIISDYEIENFLRKKENWINTKRIQIIQSSLNVKQWENEDIEIGKKILEKKVPLYIKKWEPILNVKVNSWYLRLMKSRWGSCNINTKRICINIKLSRKNDEILEYVIVHEMIHLKERSHNKIFYSYMDKYIPNWKEYKKKLAES